MRKTVIPTPVFRAVVSASWPRLFKAERVAICFIDLAESGHLDVPLDRLPDFLRAKGYPQIAHEVEQQVRARLVPRLLDIGKDDESAKRRFVKSIINGGPK